VVPRIAGQRESTRHTPFVAVGFANAENLEAVVGGAGLRHDRGVELLEDRRLLRDQPWPDAGLFTCIKAHAELPLISDER
jgi:hypothetical protein